MHHREDLNELVGENKPGQTRYLLYKVGLGKAESMPVETALTIDFLWDLESVSRKQKVSRVDQFGTLF